MSEPYIDRRGVTHPWKLPRKVKKQQRRQVVAIASAAVEKSGGRPSHLKTWYKPGYGWHCEYRHRKPRRKGPLPLWHGSGCHVPKALATCPECGGELWAKSMAWDTETGQPVGADIEVECSTWAEELDGHQWHQSDWQPVMDAIRKWCKAS